MHLNNVTFPQYNRRILEIPGKLNLLVSLRWTQIDRGEILTVELLNAGARLCSEIGEVDIRFPAVNNRVGFLHSSFGRLPISHGHLRTPKLSSSDATHYRKEDLEAFA